MVTLKKRINAYRIDDKQRDKDKFTKVDKNDKDNKDKEVDKFDKQGGKQVIEIKIKPYSTITCLGKRGTGKSFLCKWLIEKMVHQGIYNTVYLFSTTENIAIALIV